MVEYYWYENHMEVQMVQMDRKQINFRLDKEMAEKLDQRRAAMMAEMGRIPSRSEVFTIALKQYLENVQATAQKRKK